VIVHAALVESSVNDQRNVLRKLMLGSDGFTVSRPWSKGNQQTIPLDYTMDVPVADPENLYIAIFVQDKLSKRIHQSILVKAPAKQGVPPVAVPDDPRTAEISRIEVYPNPASKYFNLHMETVLRHDYTWSLIDQRGVSVADGSINHDLTTAQQISVKDLANGVYFLKIALGDGKAIVYRKVVVLNRH
jgi:hypothetical protein